MKSLWLSCLVSFLAAAQEPPGFQYTNNMTWDQAGNFSQWFNGTYLTDSQNPANVRSPIVRGPGEITLTQYYDIFPTQNSSASYIRTYFELNEPCCVTVEGSSNILPGLNNDRNPPYFVVDYSRQGERGWPFETYRYEYLKLYQRFFLTPKPDHSGWYSFHVEFQVNQFDNYYPSGSGSYATLTKLTISLGQCVDLDEQAVLYGLMGVFAFFFIFLVLLLVKLHKRKKGGRYNVPLAAWWHLLDLCTDLLFAFSMNLRGFNTACALSIFFTALPLVLHTIMGAFLFFREMKIQAFSDWYSSNRLPCNILLALMPVLGPNSMTLLGSKLGGYIPLSAPFSDRGAYLISMGTLITTTLEDIPQICIQVVTAVATKEITSIVMLSVSVSLLTVLFRFVRMIFDSFHYFGKQGLERTEDGVAAFSVPMDPKAGEKWGDWVELWDDSSQCTYYENLVTGVTTWDRPEGWVASDLPAASNTMKRRFYERRRLHWPVTIAFTFFSIGMAIRYVMDPQNFQ